MGVPAKTRHASSAMSRIRWMRVVRLVVRVLTVFVCLELSGTLALASEIGAVPDTAADDCCNDCPLEKDGKECPPLCPVCHCSHAMLAVPSALATGIQSDLPPATALVFARQRSVAPPTPSLNGLYRPPRFAPRLA